MKEKELKHETNLELLEDADLEISLSFQSYHTDLGVECVWGRTIVLDYCSLNDTMSITVNGETIVKIESNDIDIFTRLQYQCQKLYDMGIIKESEYKTSPADDPQYL